MSHSQEDIAADLRGTTPAYGSTQGVSTSVADQGKMPSELKLTKPDGSVEKMSLTKKGSRLCVPPGGWYGPFGFFRIVTIVFSVVGILSLVCFINAVKDAKIWSAICTLLLGFGAALAAMAAGAHEGLANQVTEVARQNNQFANSNAEFSGQLDKLQNTEQRLTKVENDVEQDLDELEHVIKKLNQVANLSEVNVMIRAFLQAEMLSGHADKRLTGKQELHDFWIGARKVLKKELPSFDLNEMHTLSLSVGLTYGCVSLMINAVLRNCEGHPHNIGYAGAGHHAAAAFLNLVLFSLQPTQEFRIDTCVGNLKEGFALVKNPDYGDESKLRQALEACVRGAAVVTEGPKSVPDDLLFPIAKGALKIRPWPMDAATEADANRRASMTAKKRLSAEGVGYQPLADPADPPPV